MSASVDGFINDRDGDFSWSPPDYDMFRFHLQEVGKLGAYLLGRRLYEDMRIWETDALRDTPDRIAFADVWCALPKVVFSRTLTTVDGANTRLATGLLADEVAAALAGGKDVSIGGATLAAQAFELGLVDDVRLFRYPVLVGGGTPFFPPLATAVSFDLAETRVFGHGVVYERRIRSAG